MRFDHGQAACKHAWKKAQQQPDAKPNVDPKDAATLIVASLEGALVMSRIQRNDEAPRRVQSHLNKCLDQRSGDGLQVSEMEHLYLEALHVRQRVRSGTHVMEEEKIKDFAAEFDPQPFHLGETAARASIFKGLAASGWHTAAIAMRLRGIPLANGIIGLGGAWLRPTWPGDRLHVDSEILDVTPSRSKPNKAVVSVRSTLLNQKDEPVYSLNAKLPVFKRP
jgi:acyl dehydratase